LTTLEVVEIDGVRRAEVHEEDEVDDFASDEFGIPSLESSSGYAEIADLLRDGDDEIQLGDASEPRTVSFFDEFLEVTVRWKGRGGQPVMPFLAKKVGDLPPEPFDDLTVLGHLGSDTNQVVIVLELFVGLVPL
jgi:hypothetical protein